jgi:hypothetical protein
MDGVGFALYSIASDQSSWRSQPAPSRPRSGDRGSRCARLLSRSDGGAASCAGIGDDWGLPPRCPRRVWKNSGCFHAYLFDAQPDVADLFNPRTGSGRGAQVCKRDGSINARKTDWMEWQAGYVWGALLMPISHFRRVVSDYQRVHNIFGPIALGSDRGAALINAVGTVFRVSADAARACPSTCTCSSGPRAIAIRLRPRFIRVGAGGWRCARMPRIACSATLNDNEHTRQSSLCGHVTPWTKPQQACAAERAQGHTLVLRPHGDDATAGGPAP